MHKYIVVKTDTDEGEFKIALDDIQAFGRGSSNTTLVFYLKGGHVAEVKASTAGTMAKCAEQVATALASYKKARAEVRMPSMDLRLKDVDCELTYPPTAFEVLQVAVGLSTGATYTQQTLA